MNLIIKRADDFFIKSMKENIKFATRTRNKKLKRQFKEMLHSYEQIIKKDQLRYEVNKMSDNKKKKKQDGKRISRQEWEVDYVRALAKEILQKGYDAKVKRVAKALLKFTKATPKPKKKSFLHELLQ